jgi:hypothetical protein
MLDIKNLRDLRAFAVQRSWLYVTMKKETEKKG